MTVVIHVAIHFGIVYNDKFLETTEVPNNGKMVKYIIFAKLKTMV
jgi:hypothetical protein